MAVSLSSRSPRAAALVAAVAGLALAAGLLAGAPVARAGGPPVTSATASTVGRFYSIPPTRVLATRDTRTPFGAGETRTVDLSRAVPVPASAVVINLTAADATVASQQTAFPAGTSRPYASSINELAGEVRANLVTVAVGQGSSLNKINLYNWYGAVNLVVDVLGYYSNGTGAGSAGAAYAPLAAPVRLFDTRRSIGGLTSTYPRNIGVVTIDYGSAAVNRTISSVAVNITALNPVGGGYLALWNGAGAIPTTSSLNYRSGLATANMAIVPVRCRDATCSKLTFSIYNKYSSSVQVVGDLIGAYVAAGTPGSLVYRPVAPVRIADSRYGRPFGIMFTHAVGGVAAGSWAGPAGRAAVMNVTAVRPQYTTYLTLWPNATAQPAYASLYPAYTGALTASAVQVRLGVNGSGFKIFNNVGLLTVVIDLSGTFVDDPALSSAAGPAKAGPAASPVAPSGTITGA